MEMYDTILVSSRLYKKLQSLDLPEETSPNCFLHGIKVIEDKNMPENMIAYKYPNGRVEFHKVGEENASKKESN